MNGSFVGGSILIQDSSFEGVGKAIDVSTPVGANEQQHFSIVLDNVKVNIVGTMIRDEAAGITYPGRTGTMTSWIIGKVYDTANPNGKYQKSGPASQARQTPQSLLGGPNGGFLERSKPQYEELGVIDFLVAKDVAMGEHVCSQNWMAC